MSVFDNDFSNLSENDMRRFWRMLVASSVVTLACAVLGTVSMPSVHTRIATPHASFEGGNFRAGGPGAVGGEFSVFSLFLAATYFSATADAAGYATGVVPHSRSRLTMEAVGAALSAAAAYVVLGGVMLEGLLFAVLFTFYCFYTPYYDTVWLACFAAALACTLVDGLFVTAPERAQRVVFAVTYLVFTLAAGSARCFYVRADLSVVVSVAGRVASIGQAYSLLARLGGSESEAANDVFVLASVLPVTFFGAYAYTATEQVKKPEPKFNTPKKKKLLQHPNPQPRPCFIV